VVSRSLGKPLAAVEIKSQSAPFADDFAGLAAFRTDYPRVPRFCFCTTPRPYDVEQVTVLPWAQGVRDIVGGL